MNRPRRVIVSTIVVAAATLSVLPGSGHAAPLVPAQAPSAASYVVRAGDSIIGIATKLKVKVSDLLSANQLQLTSLIYPGMRLAVPGVSSVPTPAAETPATTSYTIHGGDSLIGIAVKFNMKVSDLLALNGLTMSSVIFAGRTLQVVGAASLPPEPTPAPAAGQPTTSGLTYVVASGDFFVRIATRYGVTLGALLAANNLNVTSVIHPGDTLVLPAGAKAPAPATVPASSGGSTSPSLSPASAAKIDTVVAFLMDQRGKPYQAYAAGPDAFDCSGLVMAAYATIGISLPHYSVAQSLYGTAVDWTTEPLRAGDLVFTYSSSSPNAIGHVGVALSSTTWIQAPQPGDVVRVGPLPATTRIVAVRRLVQP